MKRHLVYLLVNRNRETGKRFYIGSKQECSVEKVNGVDTILDRVEKPYFSSSTSLLMQEDMKAGHTFEAEVLEWVPNRKDLIERENYFINLHNAVEAEEYHNKTNALMNCHDQDAVANRFGETVKLLACRNSSMGKRDNMAKSAGYNNFGEMYLWIWEQKVAGVDGSTVSKALGKERHFAFRTIKGIDIEKAKQEIDDLNAEEYQTKLRDLISEGCSLYYACELLNIEIVSGRVFLGTFNDIHKRSFRAARKRNMSKDELEKRIVQVILDSKDGEGYKIAATELNIGLEVVRRYLSRYLKKNLPYPK